MIQKLGFSQIYKILEKRRRMFLKMVGEYGWLVVLGLNATLTAKVISWRSVKHMCFLPFSHQYYHNYSFQSHRLLFSHASAELRGEKIAGKKSRLNWGSNSQSPGHESDTLTTEPSGRGW